jgi:predicted O-linked N-acetylglucosamine transferase (SPINDLY family)
VDIALDTSPYAGMTITFDCLWMGVPVVTMAGDAHVSRTGASLLSCVNLKDWIADSPRRYVEIATSRARDRQGLVKLRAQLREDLRASPLTHGADYVGALQRAFAEMWTAIGGPDRPPIS